MFFYKVIVTIPDIGTASHKVTKYDRAYSLIKRPCGPVQKVLPASFHGRVECTQVTWQLRSPGTQAPLASAASLQKEHTKEGAPGESLLLGFSGEDMKPGLERSRLELTMPFPVV